jgi:hypothetical protein
MTGIINPETEDKLDKHNHKPGMMDAGIWSLGSAESLATSTLAM